MFRLLQSRDCISADTSLDHPDKHSHLLYKTCNYRIKVSRIIQVAARKESMYLVSLQHLQSSVAVVAEISLRSPWKLLIFIIKKHVHGIKVLQKNIYNFFEKLHCYRAVDVYCLVYR